MNESCICDNPAALQVTARQRGDAVGFGGLCLAIRAWAAGLALVLLSLAQAGCATAGRAHGVWPGPLQEPFHVVRYHRDPQPMASVEEAIGTIKNLQGNMSGTGCGDVRSLDVDRYGLRLSSVTVVTKSEYVPSYGGFFLGTSYVPVYGGTYQDSSQQQYFMTIVPFKEVIGFQFASPKVPGSYWGYPGKPYTVRLAIALADGRYVPLFFTDDASAQECLNAVTTLLPPIGRNCIRTTVGAVLCDLTARQKADSGIADGVLVRDVYGDSPAGKAGLAYLDIIVGVDGIPVSSLSQYRQAVGTAGDSAMIEIRRMERKKDERGRTVRSYTPYTFKVEFNRRITAS